MADTLENGNARSCEMTEPHTIGLATNDSNSSDSESTDDGAIKKQKWDSDDEIDWSPGMEWWQVSFALVVTVIGVGVMALPNLPRKGGIVMSLVAMLVCGCAIMEGGMAMWKGFMAGNRDPSKRSDGVVIRSYEDFGREAYGVPGEALVLVGMVLYFLGVVASFGVLMAGALAHLSNHWMDTKQWLLAMFPMMALMAMLPNVTAVARIVPVAVLSIIVLVNLIVVKSILDGQRWQAWPDVDSEELFSVWPASALDMGTVVASLLGAFGINGNVPSVLCEMKDPMEFPKAFKVAMCSVGGIYLAVMCAGYYGYGNFMQSDIVDSMSSFPVDQAEAFGKQFKEWTGPKAHVMDSICNTLLFIKLVIGMPLNMMVIFYSFQTYEYTRNYFPVGSIANKLMRLTVVALAVFIGETVSNFNQLFSLVCSIFGPMLQMFLPIFFSYKIRKRLGHRKSSWMRRSLHAVIIALGIFSLTIGFGMSIKDIVDSH